MPVKTQIFLARAAGSGEILQNQRRQRPLAALMLRNIF
jgi:hypothetical protein